MGIKTERIGISVEASSDEFIRGFKNESYNWIRDIGKIWGMSWCASRICAITTDIFVVDVTITTIVVDVVTEHAREELLNEILYVDDLVLM